jgi:hypothetical protein
VKRLVWFAAGAAAGVGGTAYAKRKARQAADRYRPINLAKGAVDRVADAVREGRSAMAAKEAELKAREDGEARAPAPAPGVQVLVVEAATVEAIGPSRVGPRRRSRR